MDFVRIEKQGHVGIISLNHPPVNAVSQQVYKELGEAFLEINYMKGVRAVIFRADGKMFSAGGDVAEMGAIGNRAMEDPSFDMTRWSDLTNNLLTIAVGNIINCKYPVIMAVHGACVGAGMVFACCADIVVAADNAKMSIPEIKVGLIGAGGFATRLVPEKVARYMAYTGDLLPIAEIAKYGNIHKIVPMENLMEEAMAVANKIAENPPRTVQCFKHAMNHNTGMSDIGKTYLFELDCRKLVGTMDEVMEANTAFLQKRKPVYVD